MTIRENIIKEVLMKTTTKEMGQPTNALIENTGDELAKIKASIKVLHAAFTEETNQICGGNNDGQGISEENNPPLPRISHK